MKPYETVLQALEVEDWVAVAQRFASLAADDIQELEEAMKSSPKLSSNNSLRQAMSGLLQGTHHAQCPQLLQACNDAIHTLERQDVRVLQDAAWEIRRQEKQTNQQVNSELREVFAEPTTNRANQPLRTALASQMSLLTGDIDEAIEQASSVLWKHQHQPNPRAACEAAWTVAVIARLEDQREPEINALVVSAVSAEECGEVHVRRRALLRLRSLDVNSNRLPRMLVAAYRLITRSP